MAIQRSFRSDDRGFIMVALLIGMAVTAVWMSAMLPTWRQQAQRQREADLIFRGEQYARAIALYVRQNNGALPTSIDDLVQQRFLRKKWKDPITGEDFQVLGGSGGQAAAGPGSVQAGGPGPGQTGGQVTGGISGVYSSSTDTSIRIYRNAQQYNQWIFSYQIARQQMGQAAAPGRGGRGGDRGDAVAAGDGRAGPGGAGRGGLRGGDGRRGGGGGLRGGDAQRGGGARGGGS